MTKGEYKVGIDFNPSQDDVVGRIKRLAADFIDLVDDNNNMVQLLSFETKEDKIRAVEVARLTAIALTDIESAAMWAVKAATKGVPK